MTEQDLLAVKLDIAAEIEAVKKRVAELAEAGQELTGLQRHLVNEGAAVAVMLERARRLAAAGLGGGSGNVG